MECQCHLKISCPTFLADDCEPRWTRGRHGVPASALLSQTKIPTRREGKHVKWLEKISAGGAARVAIPRLRSEGSSNQHHPNTPPAAASLCSAPHADLRAARWWILHPSAVRGVLGWGSQGDWRRLFTSEHCRCT
ncbi:hypothetical protein O3P69_012071 [Scylla paramamosain]|uniref:Uncharacterized protein n=1 Tax=Scylla paramamosain TaxID=85552 RepID=A0AAW0SH23_SCYPA